MKYLFCYFVGNQPEDSDSSNNGTISFVILTKIFSAALCNICKYTP